MDVNGSHITVQEIRTSECSFAGIALSGSNNRVERCELTTSVAGVYVKAGSQRNQIINNKIVGNNRMSVLDRGGENDSGAFGVLVNGDRTEVAFNTITGSDAFSYDYGRDGAAVEIFGGQRNVVHHNVAIDNDAFVELGDPQAEDNTLAYNLVVSSLQTSTGVVTRGNQDSRGPVSRTRVENNTISLSGTESQGFVCFGGCSSEILAMRNNIVQSPGKVGYADAPFSEDYNLFYGGQIQFTPGPHSMIADPAFAPGGFTLSAESPAIDRGALLGYGRDLAGSPVPIDGSRDGEAVTDLGAFEYVPPGLANVGSGTVSVGQVQGDVGWRANGFHFPETVIPVLNGSGGFSAAAVQGHCDERQKWVLSLGLPSPRAAIEIKRGRRAVAERSLFRLVRMSEDIEGRTRTVFREHSPDVLRGPNQIVRRKPRPMRSLHRSAPPQHHAHQPRRQAIERRFRQQVNLSQYVSREVGLRRQFRHDVGAIAFPPGAVAWQSTGYDTTTDREGQPG